MCLTQGLREPTNNFKKKLLLYLAWLGISLFSEIIKKFEKWLPTM
jgi:hypothetical protein